MAQSTLSFGIVAAVGLGLTLARTGCAAPIKGYRSPAIERARRADISRSDMEQACFGAVRSYKRAQIAANMDDDGENWNIAHDDAKEAWTMIQEKEKEAWTMIQEIWSEMYPQVLHFSDPQGKDETWSTDMIRDYLYERSMMSDAWSMILDLLLEKEWRPDDDEWSMIRDPIRDYLSEEFPLSPDDDEKWSMEEIKYGLKWWYEVGQDITGVEAADGITCAEIWAHLQSRLEMTGEELWAHLQRPLEMTVKDNTVSDAVMELDSDAVMELEAALQLHYSSSLGFPENAIEVEFEPFQG